MAKVSIVMPTHNRAPYLKKAVESVLGQSFSDWELIIVDDGSKDNTRELLESFVAKDQRIKFITQENSGVSVARNNAMGRAEGKYIAFNDDDDEWLPQKLKTQYDFMEKNMGIGFTYTLFKIIRTNGPKAGQFSVFPKWLPTNFEEMVKCFFVPLTTVMIRKSFLAGMEWFQSFRNTSQDQEFLLRLVQRTRVAPINEVLTTTSMDERRHLGADAINCHHNIIYILDHLKLEPGFVRSKHVMKKKKAELLYLIARDHVDLKNNLKAAFYFLRAVVTDPFVGLSVRRRWEKIDNGLIRILKAYIAGPAYLLKGFIHGR